jgi:hypothetical protein
MFAVGTPAKAAPARRAISQIPTALAVSAFGTGLPAAAGSLLVPGSATAFSGEDFAHGQHVELVLFPPGVLLEEDEVGGRQIGDAHATGLQVAQARSEIVERLAAHPREDVQVELLHDANRAFLGSKVLGLKLACPALAPVDQAVQQSAQISRPVVNEDVGIEGLKGSMRLYCRRLQFAS